MSLSNVQRRDLLNLVAVRQGKPDGHTSLIQLGQALREIKEATNPHPKLADLYQQILRGPVGTANATYFIPRD